MFVIILLVVSWCPLNAQQVRKADTVAPEDLGFTKLNFEATAHAGEVVVFRHDVYADGKLISRFESISHPSPSGGKHFESVLLIDWAFFDGPNQRRSGGPYALRAGAGSYNIDSSLVAMQWTDHSDDAGNNPQATFTFQTTEHGKVVEKKFVFSIFTEVYDSVKHRHPKLPAAEAEGWGFAGSVKDVK